MALGWGILMEPESNPYSAPELEAEDERPFASLRKRIKREILAVTVLFLGGLGMLLLLTALFG